MAVILSDLLDEEQITLELTGLIKEDALSQIIGLVHRKGQVQDQEAFLSAVLARERSGSTVAANGVAFPHARTDLVKKIVLGIGRSSQGVSFGKSDELVHLIFLIGVPRRLVQDYLVCVGTLARLVQDAAIRNALLAANTSAEFVNRLHQASLA
jgi:mannitol/fructose-specific phosphotransferase system IIA component (Ntr-type)